MSIYSAILAACNDRKNTFKLYKIECLYCIRRGREDVFWPKITADITNFVVNKCSICEQIQSENQKEAMLSRELLSRPW